MLQIIFCYLDAVLGPHVLLPVLGNYAMNVVVISLPASALLTCLDLSHHSFGNVTMNLIARACQAHGMGDGECITFMHFAVDLALGSLPAVPDTQLF